MALLVVVKLHSGLLVRELPSTKWQQTGTSSATNKRPREDTLVLRSSSGDEVEQQGARQAHTGVAGTQTVDEAVFIQHHQKSLALARSHASSVCRMAANQLISSHQAAIAMKRKQPSLRSTTGTFHTYIRAEVNCIGAQGAHSFRVYSPEVYVSSSRQLRGISDQQHNSAEAQV